MTKQYWTMDVLNDEPGQAWVISRGPRFKWGSIFRCPEHMREASPSCYDPKVLTLGPYAPKEASKYASLNTQKLNVARATVTFKSVSMAELLTHLGGTSDEIKQNFGSEPDMDIEDVRRILAVDSLFVAGVMVNILLKAEDNSWFKDEERTYLKSFPGFGEDEPAYRAFQQDFAVICRDLLLLENQIPVAFLKRALRYAMAELTDERAEELLCHSIKIVISSLGFIVKLEHYEDFGIDAIKLSSCEHILHFYYRVVTGFSHERDTVIGFLDSKLPTIRELELSGLRVKSKPGNIKIAHFDKGESTIVLPQIIVNIDTETLIRNLLAFEFLAEESPVFSSYVILMLQLIGTVSDVEIMRKYQVVEVNLGEDRSVCEMWNRFTRSDLLILKIRSDEMKRIIAAQSIIKKQIWDIYRRACSSFYLILSLVAAVILLVLAFLQTLYTILGFYNTF